MLRLERPIYVKDSKNALSPYKLGGAAGGSDFDPKGKTENEDLLAEEMVVGPRESLGMMCSCFRLGR
ncbi:hypothetical protein ZOSMA_30G01330 [Zostera marina]|uniref:Uncharacterized protein n=1 Tax=Zostera marina TaxID=29655 RepID=A0A0K9PC82_ZOSMR|nr:hypothetical protein ZOSMA_30G01330 [Zostera marina]